MHSITHTFNIRENKYALDCENIIYFLLDNDTKMIFDNITKNAEVDLAMLPDVFRALAMSGYFFSDSEKEFIIPSVYDTLNVSFAPIHDCNFECKYCYAVGGKATKHYKGYFTKQKIDQLINYIYIDKYAHFKKYKFDFVSGGEPLLAFPILEYFLENIRRMDKLFSKKTTVFIVTNGTLLSQDIIQRLDMFDVYLGISIDGAEEIHNRHRLYKNGYKTYGDVVQGIKLLHASQVSSKLKNAWAMAVIACDTGSLVDVMETNINFGFKRMQMQILRVPRDHPLAFHERDLPKLKTNYIDLFDHIIAHIKQGDLSRLKMIANDNDSFGKFIKRLLLREPTFYRCFAGKNKIAVTADGEIYPCDSFCGIDDFKISSLDNSFENIAIKDKFQKAHISNRKPCVNCWANIICGGDCYFNSKLINGNIYEPDPMVCAMNRFFIEHTVELLINIFNINPYYIDYMAKLLQGG
jgi:uncharacterized protein